jgi:hypothetical protein
MQYETQRKLKFITLIHSRKNGSVSEELSHVHVPYLVNATLKKKGNVRSLYKSKHESFDTDFCLRIEQSCFIKPMIK